MGTELARIDPNAKVKTFTPESLTHLLGQLITNAGLTAGFTMTTSQIAAILVELPYDLKTRFPLLEVPELYRAFADGVRGLYGEYYGITTVSINKWFRGYMESGAHSQYLANKIDLQQNKLAEETKMTAEEIDQIIKKGIVSCFEKYKETGEVVDYGSPKYDWLFLRGFLVPDDDQIDYYLSEARQQIEAEALDKKESGYRQDRLEAKKELEELLGMNNDNAKIQSKAKNMAIRDYFEDLIGSKQDINEVINQIL